MQFQQPLDPIQSDEQLGPDVMHSQVRQPDAVLEQLPLESHEARFDLRAHDDGHAQEHVPPPTPDGAQEGREFGRRA